jgi:hypothetical protein
MGSAALPQGRAGEPISVLEEANPDYSASAYDLNLSCRKNVALCLRRVKLFRLGEVTGATPTANFQGSESEYRYVGI